MTNSEFNIKWKEHIENGFENQGLMINVLELTLYLDEVFTELKEKCPNFRYSQIKLKFGNLRIYLQDNEQEIILKSIIDDNILKKHILNDKYKYKN